MYKECLTDEENEVKKNTRKVCTWGRKQDLSSSRGTMTVPYIYIYMLRYVWLIHPCCVSDTKKKPTYNSVKHITCYKGCPKIALPCLYSHCRGNTLFITSQKQNVALSNQMNFSKFCQPLQIRQKASQNDYRSVHNQLHKADFRISRIYFLMFVIPCVYYTKEGYKSRHTKPVYIVLFMWATCFEIKWSHSCQQYKIHCKQLC